MRTDGFEYVLNRYLVTVELSWRDRSALQHDTGDVETGQRHDAARNGLVTSNQYDETIESVSAGNQLNRVRDHLAAHQRGPHSLRAHRDAVGNRHRIEFHRCRTGRTNPRLDVLGERPQMQIARTN